MNLDDCRTDKASWAHNYLMIYDTLITTPPERVLEIGAYQGGSLGVWADTWPDAEIHAIDVADLCAPGPWTLHLANAYDPALLAEDWVQDGFDLIIDDGPHDPETQVYSARHWAPLLRPGGLFVIEDVPTEERALELGAALPDDLRATSFCVLLGGFSSKDGQPWFSRMVIASR